MKKLAKKILPHFIVEFVQLKRKKEAIKNRTIRETFTIINELGSWNSPESVSGNGSELSVTAVLRKELDLLIRDKKIKSILDIPCGDFNWMNHVNLDDVNYIGGDIVENLIKSNTLQYGSDNIKFELLDLTKDPLSEVDLLLCRDCLVHLSYKDIYKALVKIKKSKSQFLLTTSFYQSDNNKNIITGQWRKLNFERFPFYFKKPIQVIDEKYTGKDGKYADKSMCLWKISDIKLSNKLRLYYWFT